MIAFGANILTADAVSSKFSALEKLTNTACELRENLYTTAFSDVNR